MQSKRNIINRITKVRQNVNKISTVYGHKKVKDECAALHALLKSHKKHFTPSELKRMKGLMKNVSKKVAKMDLSKKKKRGIRNVFKRKSTRALNMQANFRSKIQMYLKNLGLELDKYHSSVFRSFPTTGRYAPNKKTVDSLRWEKGGGPKSHIRVLQGYTTQSFRGFLDQKERELNALMLQGVFAVPNSSIFDAVMNNIVSVQGKIDNMRSLLRRWNSLKPEKRGKLWATYREFKKKYNKNRRNLAKPRPYVRTNEEANAMYEHYYGYPPQAGAKPYKPKPYSPPPQTIANILRAYR